MKNTRANKGAEEPSQLNDIVNQLTKTIDEKFKELEKNIMCRLDTKLKEFTEQLEPIIKSVEFLSAQFETLNGKVLTLTSKTAKIDHLECEIIHLKEIIKEVNDKNNQREQFDRLNNIEIHGVPTSKSENLLNIVENISQKVGFQIQKDDIDFIQRVRPWPTTTPKVVSTSTTTTNIIVRLLRRDCKDALLTAARRHRTLTTADICLPGVASRIFLNDHLTPSNKLLLKKARDLKTTNHFQYLWTKNCNLFLRKNDGSPVMRISSEADLKKIS